MRANIPSWAGTCPIYLIDSNSSMRDFLAALQVSVTTQPPSSSLAIVNLLAWGILARRSDRLGYIIEVRYRHLFSICLTVWKDQRMISLTISTVPSTDRIQESRVTCLKPPSLEILTIFFGIISAVFWSHLHAARGTWGLLLVNRRPTAW